MTSPQQDRHGRNSGPPGNLRRKTTKLNEKKVAEQDEFMASAIGDVEWLRQTLRASRGAVNFDKNVRILYVV